MSVKTLKALLLLVITCRELKKIVKAILTQHAGVHTTPLVCAPWELLAVHLESPEWAVATSPPPSVTLPLMLNLNFTSTISTFCFSATLSSLLATSVFRWPSRVIVTWLSHTETRRQPFLCVWPAEQMCPVTDTPTRWSAPWRARKSS